MPCSTLVIASKLEIGQKPIITQYACSKYNISPQIRERIRAKNNASGIMNVREYIRTSFKVKYKNKCGLCAYFVGTFKNFEN
jgi:hypothetical protein